MHPRVAYLTTYYPAPTHTFIRQEIGELEKLGCQVLRFSHHAPEKTLLDAVDVSERALTTVLMGGATKLLLSVLLTALRSPWRACATFAEAVRMAIRGDHRIVAHAGHFALACALAEKLRVVGAPHVHAHFGISPSDVAYLCSRLSGVSYSFTVHASYEYEDPARLNLREKVSGAEFVVAVSEHGRRFLGDHYPEYASKIVLVDCSLDDRWLETQCLPISAKRRLFCIARLEPQKDLHLLLDALEIVNSMCVQFEVLIAGDGSLRHELERRIARSNLNGSVRLLGWCSWSEIKSYINTSDALVLSSVSEGIPMAVLEGFALGRPAIATDVGGVSEVVLSGETGWLVQAGNPSQLAQALTQCLQSSAAQLQKMGDAGRLNVRKRTGSRSASALRNLFVKVTAGARN